MCLAAGLYMNQDMDKGTHGYNRTDDYITDDYNRAFLLPFPPSLLPAFHSCLALSIGSFSSETVCPRICLCDCDCVLH